MPSDVETATPAGRIAIGDVVRRGVVALVGALVINAVVTFAAIAAEVAPGLDPLSYGSVFTLTTAGVVGATATYGALTRLVDDPDRAFLGVAVVVLVVSLIPDFTYIPGLAAGSLLAGVVLGSMHVTTAAICVAVLTDLDLPGR